MIVHDQEVSDILDYIEYEPEMQTFVLIYQNGLSQDLGIILNEKVKKHLLNGVEVTLVQLHDKEIIAAQNATLLIKHY